MKGKNTEKMNSSKFEMYIINVLSYETDICLLLKATETKLVILGEGVCYIWWWCRRYWDTGMMYLGEWETLNLKF